MLHPSKIKASMNISNVINFTSAFHIHSLKDTRYGKQIPRTEHIYDANGDASKAINKVLICISSPLIARIKGYSLTLTYSQGLPSAYCPVLFTSDNLSPFRFSSRTSVSCTQPGRLLCRPFLSRG